MLIETIEKNIKSQMSKENKRRFLVKEIPNFINQSFSKKDVSLLEKLFFIILSLPADINKQNELNILYSINIFIQEDTETFNSLLKNKKILHFFEDHVDILSHGIFNGDIKNVFTFFKRLKYDNFFSDNNIYKYQHLFPFKNVNKTYLDLFKILEYSTGEEPLYIPYHIINNAIKQKDIMMLEIGFSFIDSNFKFQKIFTPIVWSLYSNFELEELIFLETNQDLLKDYKICQADYLCEFLEDFLYQTTDELKFFQYVLSRSQEHNKETVGMILHHLSKIPLHNRNFEFIFIIYSYLKSIKSPELYILEEIIQSNGVIELIEIIKD